MSTIITSVHQCLLSRISSGAYPVGSIMPGCRPLADELGVNKNTVTRAYRMLVDYGLIRSVPGRGMLVVRTPVGADAASVMDVSAELSGIIRRARAAGLGRSQVEDVCANAVEQWYSGGRLSLAMVECNPWDAKSLSSHIESLFGVSVTPVLLDDFLAAPGAVLPQYDLTLTTLYHFSEVVLATPAEQRNQLVVLEDHPSVRSLMELSAIPVDSKIAVVAAHERTVQLLQQTLELCGRKAAFSASTSVDSPLKIAAALEHATAVVQSERCETEVQEMGLTPGALSVVVSFEIHPQSIEFLRKRIEKLAETG